MSISSRGCGITGLRRRYCGFVFAGRSRKMLAVSPSPGRSSPGRKTPPGVLAPSAGLRLLNVSRVKCGGGPCSSHSARSLTSLAFRCALQRMQTVPAAIHSGRIPPPQPTSHGDGRLSHPPHRTGHGPFRTRPPNLS